LDELKKECLRLEKSVISAEEQKREAKTKLLEEEEEWSKTEEDL